MSYSVLMVSIAIVAGLIVVPLVLIVLLRAHGGVAFMSLCLGSVLASYVAVDITDFATQIMSLDALSSGQWVKIVLLVTPLVLALLFTAKSVSKHKQLFNVLPAAATGLLLALLVMPLLPANLQNLAEDSVLWKTISNLQTAVLLAGAFFSMVFLLLGKQKKDDKKDK